MLPINTTQTIDSGRHRQHSHNLSTTLVFDKCFLDFYFLCFIFERQFLNKFGDFHSPHQPLGLGYADGFLLSESSIKFLWLICSGITQKAERFGFCVFGLLSYYITTVLMNHLC